ncbi:MAG TPA: hypothetical protein VKQ72_19910 [Aggregatilineales bacterium]|nr:hypothetical protein [Aggregatilineales bacterium]
MIHIDGATYSVDIEWDKDGHPVYYLTGHGKIMTVKEVLEIIARAVQAVEEGSFQHVCAVYNVLDMTHLPHLARFIQGGNWPTSVRTAHIIIATQDRTLQLVASLVAVMGTKRLRTMEVCRSQEEIAPAVKRWLALPDRTREYTIQDI